MDRVHADSRSSTDTYASDTRDTDANTDAVHTNPHAVDANHTGDTDTNAGDTRNADTDARTANVAWGTNPHASDSWNAHANTRDAEQTERLGHLLLGLHVVREGHGGDAEGEDLAAVEHCSWWLVGEMDPNGVDRVSAVGWSRFEWMSSKE